VHCHAFNEISFYKNVLPGLSQPCTFSVLYAKHPATEQNSCNPAISIRLTIIRCVPLHSWHNGQQISLRGPPAFA
jgi:hypothetical protein